MTKKVNSGAIYADFKDSLYRIEFHEEIGQRRAIITRLEDIVRVLKP